MRGKILFLGGLAAGFVLGARAGREKYEELVVRGRKVLDHPTVQEAAGVAQAQATRLYSEGKDRLNHSKLGEKLSSNGSGQLTAADSAHAGTPATVGAKANSPASSTGSTSTGSTSGSGTARTKPSGTGANGTAP
ncbi:hypothetical protein AWW66_17700 [Micromonospora rosaria]|uniref:Protoporphyrinogen oxidase n=1 Tax=Micromonospora rosaria TaxID=47874 RepID=A0A136PQG5_9ACTN|nr:hypothetical protein [Micromonospora rosaria]KXK60651.1 hypothetical protein AWW66_17700 [Micromonospora rosaria]